MTSTMREVRIFETSPRRRSTPKKAGCCKVTSVFGRSLYKGVIIVSIASMIISVLLFVISFVTLYTIGSKTGYINNNLGNALNLIIFLVMCPMSIYQLVISFCLYYQAKKLGGNHFLCSLFFTSHMSILFIYGVLFSAKLVVNIYYKKIIFTFLVAIAGFLYEGLYIYFTIAVNSYMDDLDKDIYAAVS